MTHPPLVSVILPVFNGEKFLAEAIESVLAQSHRPIQLIVVDDGSTDQSGAVALRYPEVEYHRKENGGVATARNLALRQVRGEFLAFLDADDKWVPEKLAAQLKWLDKNPDFGMVFAHERFFLSAGAEAPDWLEEKFLIEDHPAFVPGTLLIRREVAEMTGEFVTHLHHEDDTEWFLRAKDTGCGMGVMPDTLLHRRIHGSNISMQSKPKPEIIFKFVKDSILRQRLQKRGKT